jgi:hypothetical protein
MLFRHFSGLWPFIGHYPKKPSMTRKLRGGGRKPLFRLMSRSYPKTTTLAPI